MIIDEVKDFRTNLIRFTVLRRKQINKKTRLERKEVDELLDWIIMKNRKGYTMVNSIPHLMAMKNRMRNKPSQWKCRAGHNGILIRPDGSLSPCFDFISYNYDWGRIWEPKFDKEELERIKSTCVENCLSTCFYTMWHYYQPIETVKWMIKHMRVGDVR